MRLLRVGLWIGACVSDVALLAATLVVASSKSTGAWIIITLAWRAWWKTGNFENWRPSLVRQYFINARCIDGRS